MFNWDIIKRFGIELIVELLLSLVLFFIVIVIVRENFNGMVIGASLFGLSLFFRILTLQVVAYLLLIYYFELKTKYKLYMFRPIFVMITYSVCYFVAIKFKLIIDFSTNNKVYIPLILFTIAIISPIIVNIYYFRKK